MLASVCLLPLTSPTSPQLFLLHLQHNSARLASHLPPFWQCLLHLISPTDWLSTVLHSSCQIDDYLTPTKTPNGRRNFRLCALVSVLPYTKISDIKSRRANKKEAKKNPWLVVVSFPISVPTDQFFPIWTHPITAFFVKEKKVQLALPGFFTSPSSLSVICLFFALSFLLSPLS